MHDSDIRQCIVVGVEIIFAGAEVFSQINAVSFDYIILSA